MSPAMRMAAMANGEIPPATAKGALESRTLRKPTVSIREKKMASKARAKTAA